MPESPSPKSSVDDVQEDSSVEACSRKKMETWLVIEPTGQKGKVGELRIYRKGIVHTAPPHQYSEAVYKYIGTLYTYTHVCTCTHE